MNIILPVLAGYPPTRCPALFTLAALTTEKCHKITNASLWTAVLMLWVNPNFWTSYYNGTLFFYSLCNEKVWQEFAAVRITFLHRWFVVNVLCLHHCLELVVAQWKDSQGRIAQPAPPFCSVTSTAGKEPGEMSAFIWKHSPATV